jgi:hypothetical protein
VIAPLALNEDELSAIEAIFLRQIDEDDAMSIMTDLAEGGFVIVNERVLAETIQMGFQRLLDMPVAERMEAMGMRPKTFVRPGFGPAQDETFTYWQETE